MAEPTPTPVPDIGAILGLGTTLGYADTLEATPTTVAEILRITTGAETVADAKWVPLGKANKHAKHAAGHKDTAAYTFDLPYSEETESDLRGLLRESKYWTITYVDGTTVKGVGYVAEVGTGNIEADNVVTTSCKVQPVDEWSIAAAPSS